MEGVGVGVVVGGAVVTTELGSAFAGTGEHGPSRNEKSSIAISPM